MTESDAHTRDLQDRVARLEAQVAWLSSLVQPAAPVPRPMAPPPLPTPRPPRRPLNPIVAVAAGGSFLFLVGAAFFLHWSIQQGWIGPELRFLLGLAVGGGLGFGAARLLLGHSPKLGAAVLLAGLGTLMLTFRWGAFSYHFYPAPLGLAATFVCTLLAGGLSARAKSGAALSGAFGVGLLSPLVFSQGGHHEVALAVYLAVLMAAALAVPYLARTGAAWLGTRTMGVVGTWALLGLATAEVTPGDAGQLFLLVLLHLLLSSLWIWLPRQGEARPAAAPLLWFSVSLAATGASWALWRELRWMPEAFAGPVLAVAALNLALVKPVRARLGDRSADLGLLALALGHLALAVPVALAWRWVGPVWGLFALGLAWALDQARAREDLDAETLRSFTWMAFGMAVAATFRWLAHGFQVWDFTSVASSLPPFFNARFAEGALAAGAWGLLARREGFPQVFGFVGVEFVGILTLSLETAHLVRWMGGTSHSASVALTLAWALAGALQWLRSLSESHPELRRGLGAAGYLWLGLASFKLVALDLEHSDVPTKALAFLGVGALILAAALIGNRQRVARKEEE